MQAQNIGRTNKGKTTQGHKPICYPITHSISTQTKKIKKNLKSRKNRENNPTYLLHKTQEKQKKTHPILQTQAKRPKPSTGHNVTTTCSIRLVSRESPAAGHEHTTTDDTWGHTLGQKGAHTIRLLLQNTGGIDHKPGGSVKLAALYEFMQEAQVDIAALTECNTTWNKLDHSELPSQQTKYWWENAHWSMSHNRQDPDSAPYQPGGTGIVVVNQLSHRAQRPGDDKAGLGRWCWARLRGKNNKHLRVVSVYRPCPSNGPLSTYQQQVRYWSVQNIDCCP